MVSVAVATELAAATVVNKYLADPFFLWELDVPAPPAPPLPPFPPLPFPPLPAAAAVVEEAVAAAAAVSVADEAVSVEEVTATAYGFVYSLV